MQPAFCGLIPSAASRPNTGFFTSSRQMNQERNDAMPAIYNARTIAKISNATRGSSATARSVLRISVATVALSAPLMLSSAALAQTAPSAAPENGATSPATDNSDIVVTAQRREESLSKVPLSMAAFNADTLKTRVVTREQDLAALVPGLVVKNGQNQNQVSFTMRGQTLDPFSGASPAVLTYLNEVPFSGGNSATAFYDFSSVQVLKGPQGTLFGRNATGGAVLYQSALPGDSFGGYLTARGGERNLRQVEGAIDIPLIPEKLLIRIAGDYQAQDGYIRNLLAGGTLGDIDNKSARITVVAKPTDKITNTTVFQYSKFGGTEAGSQLYSYYKMGQTNNGYALTTTLDTVYGQGLFPGVGNGPPGPGTFPGAVAGYLAWQKAHPYEMYLAYRLPHDAHNYFLSNTTTIDLDSRVTFKNIFGYQSSFARTPGILSGSPFASLDLYNTSGAFAGPPGGEVFRNRSISEEAQIQGTALAGGRLKYIIGGFYNFSTKEEGIPVIVGGELATPLGQVLYHTRGTDESKALYAQATYDFSDWIQGLSFTAGGRYTWEDVGMTAYPDHAFAANFPLEQKSLKAPSWNVNIQYQFNPHNQIYFTQRGSFRSGNFNGAVVPYNLVNFFKNEYTHDFEIGYKFNGRIAGRRAHFNIAAYQQIVRNAQHSIYAVVAGAPSAFTVNVPEATIRGIEVDGDIQPTNWLQLGFSGAYTHAKYTKNQVNLSSQTGIPGYVVPFDSYPDAPSIAGSVYADITLPVPSEMGEVHLRADTFSQSHSYFSNNNFSLTPDTRIKGYTTVQMRLSWNDIMGSKISAGVYVKNLLDKLYYQSGYVEGASGGFNTVIPGEPRTIGAELTVKF
ncbi:TonB-dependent receptor [Sphingomonas lycopersici]|uniref:TonB-dependent receptor n=1 Tax=Sphingomonas lycopersici TaxID=2951807 RepID=UPI00223789F1